MRRRNPAVPPELVAELVFLGLRDHQALRGYRSQDLLVLLDQWGLPVPQARLVLPVLQAQTVQTVQTVWMGKTPYSGK
jgi:hypothetical protein